MSVIEYAGTVGRAKRAHQISGEGEKRVVRGGKVLRKRSWEPREDIILYLSDMRAGGGKVPQKMVAITQALRVFGRLGAGLPWCLCSIDNRTCSSFSV